MTKTKCVTFVPGRIRTRLSNRAYALQQDGLVSADTWHRRRVECNHYGQGMQARHLYQHLETTHGVYRSRVIDRELLLEREERTFRAHRSHARGSYFCCVPGAMGR